MITLEIPIKEYVMLEINQWHYRIPDIYFTIISKNNYVSKVKIIFKKYNNYAINCPKNIYNSPDDRDLLSYVRLNGPKVKVVEYLTEYGNNYTYLGTKNQVIIYYPVNTDDIPFTVLEEFDYYGRNGKIKNPRYIYNNYSKIFDFLEYYKSEIIRITFSNNYYEFLNSLNNFLNAFYKKRRFNLTCDNLYVDALVFKNKVV